MIFLDLFTCKGTYMIDWVGRSALEFDCSEVTSSVRVSITVAKTYKMP